MTAKQEVTGEQPLADLHLDVGHCEHLSHFERFSCCCSLRFDRLLLFGNFLSLGLICSY
jgi:hypothetical protein